MKILTIASILPVPDLIHENDYVVTLMDEVKKKNSDFEFQALRPSPFLPIVPGKKWKVLRKLKNIQSYTIKEWSVKILPYMAIASSSFLFAISSICSVLCNKKRLIAMVKDVSLTHAHFIFPDGYIAYYLKQKYNIPYIVTLHAEQRLFKGKYSKKLALKILKDADALVSISPLMIEFLKKEPGIKGIKFIGHGVDHSFFQTELSKPEPGTGIKILSIGKLYWLKNFKCLIEAVSNLQNRHHVSLTIVGDGDDKSFLEQYVKELKLNEQVQFISHIDNKALAGFMKGFDIFILPSFKETWGRVYIEAMAAGLPVILTKNTGVYGIITEKEHALVVNPESTADITSKLLLLIENEHLRNNIALNGQKLVHTFSWDKVAEEYTSIYHQIIK